MTARDHGCFHPPSRFSRPMESWWAVTPTQDRGTRERPLELGGFSPDLRVPFLRPVSHRACEHETLSMGVAPVVSPERPRHMPQLDGLRALAVFGVLIEHYFKPTDVIRETLPWGTLGVRLFFVLSGFLITGILFRGRPRDNEAGELWALLRAFYARRFIRLMPVYYLYLAATALMLPIARNYLWAFVLYLQNFLFAYDPGVFVVLMAHFWTLAVEEQFYLTWPFIVLLVPRRRLPQVMLGVVLLGPALRALGLLFGFTPHQVNMMMPAHCDTLGLGGLLAVLTAGTATEKAWANRLISLGLRLGLPFTIAACIAFRFEAKKLELLVGETGMGLLFTWLIARAAVGFGGLGGSFLTARPLQYLGKISYGIYVYHFNVPGLLRERLAPRLGLTLPDNPWVRFLIFGAVSILVAALSWKLVEQPLNRLKGRFAYRAASPRPP